MPKKQTSSNIFPRLPRISQVNGYYCGPATVQMLCGFLGYEVSQQKIVDAVTTEAKIKQYGITVEELGEAINSLGLGLAFWVKSFASLSDLSVAVNKYEYPVGVEWQGVFDYPEEEAYGDEDDDPGHVAIIIKVDTRNNELLIVDPFAYYTHKDRRFTIIDFERRWWDSNYIIDKKTRKVKEVENYHVMFVVTPEIENWPEKLGMRRYE